MNALERCAHYHDAFHVKTDNGLWYCEYCRQRREQTTVARALLLRLKLGITDAHVSDLSGGIL